MKVPEGFLCAPHSLRVNHRIVPILSSIEIDECASVFSLILLFSVFRIIPSLSLSYQFCLNFVSEWNEPFDIIIIIRLLQNIVRFILSSNQNDSYINSYV